MSKLVISAVVTKGSIMSFTLYAVLTSHLSEFAKGIIIASVSATITGIFAVIAAVWAANIAERKIAEPLHDVKKKVGADKRDTDTKR